MAAFVINNPSDQTCQTRYRSSLMKNNACIRFITVTHIITSLNAITPQSLWLAIWNWLLEHLRPMRHGCGL